MGKFLFALFVFLALGLLLVAYSDADDGGADDALEVPDAAASAGSGSGSGSDSGSATTGTFTSRDAAASFAGGACTISATQRGADYSYSVSCTPPTTFTWRGASFDGCRSARVEWPPHTVTPSNVSGDFRDMYGDCGPGVVTAHLMMADGTLYDVALSLETLGMVDALPLAS